MHEMSRDPGILCLEKVVMERVCRAWGVGSHLFSSSWVLFSLSFTFNWLLISLPAAYISLPMSWTLQAQVEAAERIVTWILISRKLDARLCYRSFSSWWRSICKLSPKLNPNPSSMKLQILKSMGVFLRKRLRLAYHIQKIIANPGQRMCPTRSRPAQGKRSTWGGRFRAFR